MSVLRRSNNRLLEKLGAGHHSDQPFFDMQGQQGDPGFRTLDRETLFGDFLVDHDYDDLCDARKDPNIVLPLDRLRELLNEGLLGRVAKPLYGFMGHIDPVLLTPA